MLKLWNDKTFHTIACFLASSILYVLTHDLITSITATLTIGILKEFLDYTYSSGIFVWQDILADIGGIIIFLTLHSIGIFKLFI